MVWSRLAYSGTRTLGYQTYKFEGDPDAFSSLTNWGTGLQHFTDVGNFSVQGNKLFDLLDFRATFTDNRFSDPEQQQYTLNYKRGFWDLSYGTVQASLLNGNRFASFSRSLKGFVGDYKTGKLEAKVITSTVRGQARTVTIEGNNTSGPYYLSAGRIIGGTVKILLDGVELRQGADYVVDISLGSITFIGRVVAPTSTVVASYESYEIAGSGGTIQGGALAYDLGKAGKIGLTAQQQLVGGGNSSPVVVQQYQGFGNVGDQYGLDAEPIPATVVCRVNGTIRSFSPVDDGISDFFLSPTVHNFVISRIAVLPSQTLQIEYIPKFVQSVDGDRKVIGVDWRVPFGPKNGNSYVIFTKAHGSMSGSSSSSGDAQAIDLRFNQAKGEFKMGLRRIDPGYRTIEQTGFNRNEDASEFTYNYNTRGYTATTGLTNSLISINNGSTASKTRLSNTDLSISYSDPRNASKNLTRTQKIYWDTTKVQTTDDSRLSTLGFKDDYHKNKITFGYGLEDVKGRGRINGDMTDIGVDSLRSNATYDAGKNWSIIASASRSNVKTDTISSQGYDYSLRAAMAQRGPWTLGAEYALSDSGILASLGGFLNGNSIGFGGGGFGSSGGTGIISTGQLKARRAGFNLTHQAGDNLTLGASYINTTSIGSTTNNAKIDQVNLTTNWTLNKSNTIYFDFSHVRADFLTSLSGATNSDTFAGYLSGNPGKLWTYNLGYNILKTTGSSLGQDNLGFSFDLGFRLARRQRLFFNSAISKTRGAFPQDDTSLQSGYEYTLAPGVNLTGKYSFRNLRNLDPAAIGGAFRANGLILELRFDLSNRR